MKKIIALFGWKYVKDNSNGKYHHYKCPELNGILNQETFNKSGMKEDLARHPYSLITDKCLEEIV
ncbi:MAG: hypothetical protein PF484_06290 [Bacteroidales bacterium]|jgi:hypothetical protein|nr:hypothetical protein [Bacteroidales bacterium]